jgi:hypothetical protein
MAWIRDDSDNFPKDVLDRRFMTRENLIALLQNAVPENTILWPNRVRNLTVFRVLDNNEWEYLGAIALGPETYDAADGAKYDVNGKEI